MLVDVDVLGGGGEYLITPPMAEHPASKVGEFLVTGMDVGMSDRGVDKLNAIVLSPSDDQGRGWGFSDRCRSVWTERLHSPARRQSIGQAVYDVARSHADHGS
jgi:hypothetical protein